jgi:hypothetical protein
LLSGALPGLFAAAIENLNMKGIEPEWKTWMGLPVLDLHPGMFGFFFSL